jgi:hypothetical protein
MSLLLCDIPQVLKQKAGRFVRENIEIFVTEPSRNTTERVR